MSTILARDVMTTEVITVSPTATVREAAARMANADIGDVLVEADRVLVGILTDRDIVVRVVAKGEPAETTSVGEVCSPDLDSVSPDDPVSEIVRLMRGSALRRIPVTEKGRPIGIVSLGDLARDRDPRSTLADISAALPNS